MTEESQGPAPEGREDSAQVEVGEPRSAEEDARAEREDARPDLDEREQRIRTERKPMGPPLEEPEDLAEGGLPAEAPPEPAEPPADPEES